MSSPAADTPRAAANVILEITKQNFRITLTVLLYRIAQLLALPFIVLYFTGRLLINGTYRSHFGERFGFLPRLFSRTSSGSIWLHAVSVGEVTSALPLLAHLREDRPLVPIYLSTSTVTGRNAAKKQTSNLVDGIFYSPFDYASCVRRVLKSIRPALVIVLETELWPNLYVETRRSGARLAIVNGRISDRTWPRYRRWRRFFSPILQQAGLVLVQSETDRERYLELGAVPSTLQILGNLKYDASFSSSSIHVPTFGARQVWIAASTVGANERGSLEKHIIDEEDLVLDAFEHLERDFTRLLLILAPRQQARFHSVARKLEERGARFLRRSEMKTGIDQELQLPGVLLLDTIGELAGIYALADVVFVGGSIAPRGGHNILEPAAAGLPIIVGPHMQNFSAIARDFLLAEALIQIRDGSELLPAVRGLLLDHERARHFGIRARQVVESQRGASRRIVDQLWPLYHSAWLKTPRGPLARLLLMPFAALWKQGGILKRHRSQQKAASLLPLSVPVLSIGGITVGGSGKTPFTTYLAEQMRLRGFSPAILTRGYRRQSPAEHMVFAAGSRVPVPLTGDEAQIFLRAGIAPIGIGATRYETAKILLRRFPSTDVLLLDDGFQHARLHRDVDLVLIDGLDPFGRDALVPLGRLREPLEALARANAFVVTRADEDARFDAISARLRQYNPGAPIFRTRLIKRGWRDYKTGSRIPDLTGRKVAAFCGLGNPQAFWRTLEKLGLSVVFRWSFDDHHVYKPFELQRIASQARARGASILVTTEKDRLNCPHHLEMAIHPLSLAWLEIHLELEDEASFFSFLEKTIRKRSAAGAA